MPDNDAPERPDHATQTILRLFEARERALRAARELLNNGFAGNRVVLIVSRDVDSQSAGAADPMKDEVTRMGIREDDAPRYVDSLRRGGSMVRVDVPRDRAADAARILDEHGPAAAPDAPGGSRYMDDREQLRSLSRGSVGGARADHHPEPADEPGSDDPAPLSHALHAPTLSDDPAPLSHLLHIPVLSDD